MDREALRRERLVKNEQAARAYNNRRLRFELDDTGADDEPVPFLCECGDQSCAEAMEMTGDDFMSIHSAPNRFAVLPGHVLGDVEWVVETGERFWVVEKRPSAMASNE
ncbi:MAG TPA: hypothetical protein VH459_11410 [Gaiellales bacterium]